MHSDCIAFMISHSVAASFTFDSAARNSIATRTFDVSRVTEVAEMVMPDTLARNTLTTIADLEAL